MKLTRDNYFSVEANQQYMSVSQFKDFCECEAMAMAKINGEYKTEPSKAMLVGQYVDAYYEGRLAEFQAANPDIFTKQGTLKSEYKQAEDIINRINRDEFFRSHFNGEQQVIMTGDIAGVPFKIMIDHLFDDKIVDRKIMRDCEDMWNNGVKMPFWQAWGYDIQAAVYTAIEWIPKAYLQVNTILPKEIKPFILAVATKESEPDLRLFRFTESSLGIAFNYVVDNAPKFQAIKNGEIKPTACGKCDYCKSVKKLDINSYEEI